MAKITVKKRRLAEVSGEGFAQVSLRLPEELASELRDRAARDERTLSSLVRVLLKQGVEQMQPVCGKGGTER
jgi:hypothetical protein